MESSAPAPQVPPERMSMPTPTTRNPSRRNLAATAAPSTHLPLTRNRRILRTLPSCT